jgi:hypothetical protein
MKHPPRQVTNDKENKMIEKFIAEKKGEKENGCRPTKYV